MTRLLSFIFVLVLCSFSVTATADDDQARAAAQVLFDEGRALSDEGDHKAACVKFQESMKLHEATGTQLNLARCYEKIDKLASAWINWVEAKQRATAAGQDKRAKIAADRAQALSGRISYITVRVQKPVDDLRIERDGTELGRPQWDTKLPIDGGRHTIVARADGYVTWEKKVRIKKEGSHVVVRVPELGKAASPDPTPVPDPVVEPSPDPTPDPAPTSPADSSGVSGQMVAGIVFTVIGAAGLGMGIGFGVSAMNNNDESLTHCPSDPNECSREGVDLRVQAFTFSYISTTGFIAAGVGSLVGIVLMATAPSGDTRPERTGLYLAPVPHGLGLGGRF